MARGVLTINQITRDGLTAGSETNGDASNGHQVQNDERVFIQVRNSNGGSTARVVTFETPGNVDQQAVADRTSSLAAGATKLFGPFPVSQYGDTLLIDVDNAELKIVAYRL